MSPEDAKDIFEFVVCLVGVVVACLGIAALWYAGTEWLLLVFRDRRYRREYSKGSK